MAGALDCPTIDGAESHGRSTESNLDLVDVRRHCAVDGTRLDLQNIRGRKRIRVEVLLADWPTGVRYVFPGLEVHGVEGTAPSRPMARGPAELAQPGTVQFVVGVADDVAAVEVLR